MKTNIVDEATCYYDFITLKNIRHHLIHYQDILINLKANIITHYFLSFYLIFYDFFFHYFVIWYFDYFFNRINYISCEHTFTLKLLLSFFLELNFFKFNWISPLFLQHFFMEKLLLYLSILKDFLLNILLLFSTVFLLSSLAFCAVSLI